MSSRKLKSDHGMGVPLPPPGPRDPQPLPSRSGAALGTVATPPSRPSVPASPTPWARLAWGPFSALPPHTSGKRALQSLTLQLCSRIIALSPSEPRLWGFALNFYRRTFMH